MTSFFLGRQFSADGNPAMTERDGPLLRSTRTNGSGDLGAAEGRFIAERKLENGGEITGGDVHVTAQTTRERKIASGHCSNRRFFERSCRGFFANDIANTVAQSDETRIGMKLADPIPIKG